MSRKANTCLIVIISLFLAYYFTTHDFFKKDIDTKINETAKVLKKYTKKFIAKKKTTLEKLKEFKEDYEETVIKEKKLKFSDPNVKKMIEKFEEYKKSVNSLANTLEKLEKTGLEYFALVKKKIETITNQELKTKLKNIMLKKLDNFIQQAQSADKMVAKLKKHLKYTNEVIEAIKVVGALNSVSDLSNQMQDVMKKSVKLMQDLDNLFNEATKTFDREFEMIASDEIKM